MIFRIGKIGFCFDFKDFNKDLNGITLYDISATILKENDIFFSTKDFNYFGFDSYLKSKILD